MSSPITEKDLYECYSCKQTVDYQMRDDKSGICIRCYRCGDCGCNCEEMDEEEDICARKCEDCSVKLYGDDEGDKCQDCLDQEEEEEQRCPCGLTLSDDDLALESGKCEGCTMKGKLPDACQDCGADPVWIKAFDRYSVVDGLCENCYHE